MQIRHANMGWLASHLASCISGPAVQLRWSGPQQLLTQFTHSLRMAQNVPDSSSGMT